MAKPDQPNHRIFDRALLRKRRDRAAASLDDHDFLLREVGARLIERLDDVTRRFGRVLDLGCHTGQLSTLLASRAGVELLVSADLSPRMVAHAPRVRLAADEEWLPIGDGALDLVTSLLSLHWVNDLPGALLQIRRALRPDGLFLAALLGGDTLTELRQALLQAEAEREGGVSPRVSPFADVQDCGALLQRAGFALPVVDTDRITATYPDAFALMRELRGMGETNALVQRDGGRLSRQTLLHAAARYQEMFAEPDGRIPATFQIIYLTGWCPHESQQKPARRGSGQVHLADALSDRTRPDGARQT